MLVLITYDVNTEDAAGRRRLRWVARQCVNYGQRVQNSVFECVLIQIADLERDSLRFYMLGNNYKSKVEHFEIKPSYEAEGVLMV